MKKIKVVGGVLALLVVGISVLFYVVSSKINTEDLKKMLEQKIEEALPGTDADIENLSYRLGTQVTVNISKMNIKTLKPFMGESELFSVNQIFLNIPFGAILFGGGTIDLEIENPQILLALGKETSNWQQVIKTSPEPTEKVDTKIVETSPTELPAFLANSKVNLRFSDISFKLKEADKTSSFLIEKVLVKNFGIKSKSAFEVASNINYALSSEEVVKSKILLIGQFDTQAFFSESKIKSSILVDVKDIVYPDGSISIPNIHGDLDINLVKKVLTVETKFKAINLFELEMKLKSNPERVEVSDFNFNMELNRVSSFLRSDELLKNISFNGSHFIIKGSASVDNIKKTIKPKFVYETTKPVFLFEKGVKISNTLKGDFSNTDLKGSVKSELMGGVVLSSFNMVLDLNAIEESNSLLNTIFVNIKGSNLRLTRAMVQKFAYGVSAEKKPVTTNANEEIKPEPFPELPKVNISLDFSPLFFDDESVDIKGKLFSRPKEFGTKDLKFNIGKGRGDIDVQGRLTKHEVSADLNFKMTDLNLTSINTFLPSFITGIEGTSNGSVKGSLKKGRELSYDLNYNISAKDGELKNLNLASFITPYLDNISVLKGKLDQKDLNLTDRFKLLEAQGKMTEKYIDLTRFNFLAQGNSADISANGKVYLVESGSSRVYADIKDKSGKLNKALRGVNSLPILLEGKGMGLKPNFAYTTKKVAGTAAKAAAKKSIDKVIKKNKDKAKKLLKGLFK